MKSIPGDTRGQRQLNNTEGIDVYRKLGETGWIALPL